VVTLDLDKQAIGMAIAAPYLLIAALTLRDRTRAKELIFAPFYSALLICASGNYLGDAVALYTAVFLIGVVALYRVNKITLSYGLFAGMLVALGAQTILTETTKTSLAIISAMTIVALAVYTLRAITRDNSNLRNFLSLSLAALLILPMIVVLTEEPYPYWLWPLAAAAFYDAIYRIGKTSVKPMAIAWIALTIIGAVWLTHIFGPDTDIFGPSKRFGERLPALATIISAVALYVVGFTIQNRFVCNLARMLLLASGYICLMIAKQAAGSFVEGHGATSQAEFAVLLTWHDFGLVTAFLLALLTALAVAASLSDPPPRAVTSWWRGIVKPRHAVVLRTLYRASVASLESAPILGGLFKILRNGLTKLRYLKTGGGPINFGDSTIPIVLVLFALAEIALILAGLPMVDAKGEHIWRWLAETTAWTSCAVFSYAVGLARRQTLFTFIGVGFALVPFVRFVEKSITLNIGIIVLTAGLTLVVCSLLRRYLAPRF